MSLFTTLMFVLFFISSPLFVFSSEDNKNCDEQFSCGKLQNLSYPFGTELGCGDPDFHLHDCGSTPYILKQDNAPIYLLDFLKLDDYVVKLLVTIHFNVKICSSNISNIISGNLSLGSQYKSFEGNSVKKLYICENDDDDDDDNNNDDGCAPQLVENFTSSRCYNKNSKLPIAIPYGSEISNNDSSNIFTKVGFFLQAQVSSERADPCRSCLQNSSSNFCGYNLSDKSFLCFKNHNQGGGKSNNKNASAIIGGVVGAVGLLLLGFLILFLWKCRDKKRGNTSSVNSLLTSSRTSSSSKDTTDEEYATRNTVEGVRIFPYEELRDATDSFSDKNELGGGGFASVYHGRLRDGREVAVKKLYDHRHTRKLDEFLKEAQVYINLLHPNVVRLYGCTSPSSPELLLVFEYVANGTLADHLHGGRKGNNGGLSLLTRLKIALQIADALFFLHNNDPPIIHRDVKSLNILLDQHMDTKIADFGLSRSVPVNATHVTTAPQGTPGYVDPEYHQCYKVTDKSDVYSFGVVLVEIISGMMPIDSHRCGSHINLAIMAVSKVQEGALDDLVDPALKAVMERDEGAREVVSCVAELAFRCVADKGDDRPAMKEVVEVLRELREKYDKSSLNQTRSPVSVHEKWPSTTTTPNSSTERVYQG